MVIIMNKYEQQIHYFDKFKEWIQEEVNARDYLKSLEQLEAIEIRLWEIQNSMEDSEIKDEIIKIILNIEDRLIYIREEKYTEPFWEDKWDWFDKECVRIFGCKFEDYYEFVEEMSEIQQKVFNGDLSDFEELQL